MSTRNTPAKYHALARQRGFTWLGPEVPNVKTKTTWQCAAGHQWLATYATIQMHGCRQCYQASYWKQPADYHKLAEIKGVTWQGPEVRRTTDETTWQCNCGYAWQSSYTSLKQGKGCPRCHPTRKTKQEQDYTKLAQDSGLEWLGPMPRDTSTKTGWRCEEGHIWYKTYQRVVKHPYCFLCRGQTYRTDESYFALGEATGHAWLGPNTPAPHLPTNWMCWQRHHWTASYEELEAGAGCPECAEGTS